MRLVGLASTRSRAVRFGVPSRQVWRAEPSGLAGIEEARAIGRMFVAFPRSGTPEEVRALLARLTGKAVDESVAVFPPFYSEFGKNLTLGKGVFINIGCRFQDTGGITIGDGSLIGHGSALTTLDHGIDPDRRADMVPAPVVIGRKVWLGAAVTVVPGVPAKLIGCDRAEGSMV